MKKLFTRFYFLVVLSVISSVAFSQDGVRIAASAGAADPSAMLDVVSSNRGLLVPRVNLVALSNGSSPIASPATGLLVYNLGAGGVPSVGFYYWTGAAWVQLTAGGFSGAGTTNYVTRWTAPNALGTGVLYDDGGNVGVGTASPGQKLDVAGNVQISGGTPFILTSTGTGTYTETVIYHNNTTEGLYIDLARNTNAPSGIPIDFKINARGGGADFFTIKGSTGNVGIGTLNPTQKLTVAGLIESTSGGIKFPDGTIQPTQSALLQEKYNVFTATTTFTTPYTYFDAAGSDISITAKKSGSIFKITVVGQGYQSSGGGTNIGIKYVNTGALIAGVNGTSGDTWAGSGNGSATNSWTITRIAFHNPGTVAGTTYTYRATIGLWSSGTVWLNYPGYNLSSIITVEEIAQ